MYFNKEFRASVMKENLRKIKVDDDLGIILSDGCRLSARTWIPENADEFPVPAILEYLPYRKRDGTVARDELTHPYFAKRGYASVRVDIRGNGDSQGIMEDEYTTQELSDAVEVINWLAKQTWCSGTVGMMGISWGGFNALQVAALQPEPLKAIITLCSTVDRYADDIHYKGGCLLNENLGWGSTMWAYSSRPPDPALVGEAWREMWLERLESEPFLPIEWLKHQRRDDYWKHGSICEDYSKIKAATLAIGGWGDAYKNTVSHLVENLSCPVKGIVGPWVHKYPHFAVPGPRIDFLHEALRWWDRWLKNENTKVENDPAYTVYLMEGVKPKSSYDYRKGHWVSFDEWPNQPSIKPLYLSTNSTLSDEKNFEKTIISSPQTCGLDGGEYCAIWLGPELPGDQRIDDAQSVIFTTEQLGDELDIVGAPEVKLKLRSFTSTAQIAVRLNHIHPDGASTRITYGVFNLGHVDGHDKPRKLKKGEAVALTFNLDQIAYRVSKGHKIRLSISNSYWPLLWPMPDNGQIEIIEGSIEIPIIEGGSSDMRSFLPEKTDEPWKTETIRKSSNIRKVTRDIGSDQSILEIVDDFGLVRDSAHGLEIGSIAREWWTIHPSDPLSAEGRTHWTEERNRGDWRTRTETFATMHSDADNFYIQAKLEAYENETLLFEKKFSETISRDSH